VILIKRPTTPFQISSDAGTVASFFVVASAAALMHKVEEKYHELLQNKIWKSKKDTNGVVLTTHIKSLANSLQGNKNNSSKYKDTNLQEGRIQVQVWKYDNT
jgi:hypothetical protein